MRPALKLCHRTIWQFGNESTIQKGAVKNSGPAKTAEQGDVSEKA